MRSAMVVEQGDEILDWEVEHLLSRRGPDRSTRRRVIIARKQQCEFALGKILAERSTSADRRDTVRCS
jgi:hypothetical protein